MLQLSKKTISIIIGVVILVSVGIASVIHITESEGGFHHSRYNLSREENDIFENTSRKVVSTESGATISITFGNSGSLSEAHALFEIMRGSSEYKNITYSLGGGVQGDTLSITVTSDVPDVVKYIQKELTTSSDNDNNEKGFGIEFLIGNTKQGGRKIESKYHEKGKRERRNNK